MMLAFQRSLWGPLRKTRRLLLCKSSGSFHALLCRALLPCNARCYVSWWYLVTLFIMPAASAYLMAAIDLLDQRR